MKGFECGCIIDIFVELLAELLHVPCMYVFVRKGIWGFERIWDWPVDIDCFLLLSFAWIHLMLALIPFSSIVLPNLPYVIVIVMHAASTHR